ncbi:nucleotidyltransferase domain-containing protein [uncultured Methylobacterium sp.]|uniref:nucleotidyltransferase domain-containing protein n=1 Tax=uncultured Methylobacterium sp. TaxID=157278 RepID=UPI0035C99C5A
MAVRLNDDPVLAHFRNAVERAYGAQIERLVLFGSRARGEARAGSDYDVGVFLHDLRDFDREARTLAD